MSTKEAQFKELVSENSGLIKRICSYYSPDMDEQKDIYQEVLINIWKSLDNFRGEATVSTWIYRIAVNTSLSFMGKSYKKMRLNISIDTLNLKSLMEDASYEEKLKEEAQLNRLQIELNQLSVIDKALISLQLEGLSIKEIADVIGITEPNVKVKIHRIKETLRNQLKGGDHDNE